MRSIFIPILLFVSATANAAVVTWTFQDAVFDDGATLSGSIIIDTGGNGPVIKDVNLSIAGGNLSDTNFVNYTSGGVSWEVDQYFFGNIIENTPAPANLTGERVLQLALLGDLSTAGTIALTPAVDVADIFSGPPPGQYFFYNREGVCTTASCAMLDVTGTRNLVSGNIVGVAAVPIPAAVWLFGSALAGLGWLRRKQAV